MKMLKADQVAERIGYSRAALYAKVAQGAFPRGKKMGAANRWPDYVVDAWNILFWNLNEPLPSASSRDDHPDTPHDYMSLPPNCLIHALTASRCVRAGTPSRATSWMRCGENHVALSHPNRYQGFSD